LLAPVRELLRAELFSEHDGGLRFRHDLLREAVLATLPASAHRALQRQAVDAMIASGVPPVEVAVALAASATQGDVAAVRTLHAAVDALATSDPHTAADLSRRALDLSSATDPLRRTLVAQTALLLHAAGRVAEGKAFLDGVLREALPVEYESDVRLGIARMIALAPDVRAEAGRHALELPGMPPALRARHLTVLVHNLTVGGYLEQARDLMAEATEAVETSAGPNAAFALELAEGGLAAGHGDYGRSLALIESRPGRIGATTRPSSSAGRSRSKAGRARRGTPAGCGGGCARWACAGG
jgi:hypothetical protein